MQKLTIVYGTEEQTILVSSDTLIGDAIQETGLPIEQPCAGRGTCGKCKVIIEEGNIPPDEVENEHLTPGELALNTRLACRARAVDDARIILSHIVVYSNKSFQGSSSYKRTDDPLGLAIDLGSTTVAAFLTNLNTGEVCAGAATLNQQTTFGADVISRIGAVLDDPRNTERLHKLALASINQAVDSLKLGKRFYDRITRVSIVGNVAMYHLIAEFPVESLGAMPFQPHDSRPIYDASAMMDNIFPDSIKVTLPPLIGGFVGSDALACLAEFGFNNPSGPMVAIDLGTNGEVLVTDGEEILTASTAAGPAFEGVNISCGSRAIDGAVVQGKIEGEKFVFTTINDEPPIGLTGSGLLSTVFELVRYGVIEKSGRINRNPEIMKDRILIDERGAPSIRLGDGPHMTLTQLDIRELQKAKGAIRAAVDTLMHQLSLNPGDLEKILLTGSFGGQVDINATMQIGMIPNIPLSKVDTVANGAGLGAAKFLTDEGFELGVKLAQKAKQVDLDQDPNFVMLYIESMAFPFLEGGQGS
jgi:uncharacterized 2Fe-2S/4Fe-4S cluster protein (DUF4445 family)